MAEDREYVFGGLVNYSFNYAGNPRLLAYITALRNKIREKLDPTETNLKWIVSDIVMGQHSVSTGIKTFYFVVRHMDGAGAATGPEWLFVFTHTFNAGAPSASNFFPATSGYALNLEYSNSTVGSYTPNPFHVLYNPDCTTSTYTIGFENTTTLRNDSWSAIRLNANFTTFTAGETILCELNDDSFATATYRGRVDISGSFPPFIFIEDLSDTDLKSGGIIKDQATELKTTTSYNVPATYPQFSHWPVVYSGDFIFYTTLSAGALPLNNASFWPTGTTSTIPYGITPCFPWASTKVGASLFIFDWNKPFVGVYGEMAKTGFYTECSLLGKLITPYESGGDPNCTISFTSTLPANSVNYAHRVLFRFSCAALYDVYSVGNVATWSRKETGTYVKQWSAQHTNGQFLWNTLGIYNANENKGYIDPDIIVEVGGSSVDIGRIFEGTQGPFCKMFQYLALPWVTGLPSPGLVPWGVDGITDDLGILDDFGPSMQYASS